MPKHIDIPSQNDLKQLMAVSEPACVSESRPVCTWLNASAGIESASFQ